MSIKRKTIGMFGALVGTLVATNCDDSFYKQGNPLAGTKYGASVTIKDLTVPDAIAQLHGIAIKENLDILSEDATNGSMLLEDKASFKHKAIPYVIAVSAEGNAASIQLLVKLNKGAVAKAEDAKSGICGILNAVKGGGAGLLAARQGADAVSTAGRRQVDAVQFSLELARQNQDSAESIPLRYKDKRFTLTGRADYVIKDGDAYRIAFDIPEPSKMLIQAPGSPHYKINISCLMAPNQAAWAVAVRKGEKLKLTGVYADYDQFRKVFWLENCRP